MGMFDLFKKGASAPDIGQEEKYDATHVDEVVEDAEEVGTPKKVLSSGPKGEVQKVASGSVSNDFEAEKINARVDSVVEWIKQFYERFAYMSESIGQVKAMNLASEKRISRSMMEAEKAIDIVKDVKPEQLRIDYQKADLKISTLNEKLESNKQFMNGMIDDMNDLKRKSEVFIGTEGLMKLNEDTKKELLEIQKLGSKSKMNADKVQELFIEVRKSFADMQRAKDIIDSFEASYSGLKSAIEKLRLNYSDVVQRDDYLNFKKSYGNKLAVFDANVSDVKDLRRIVEDATSLIETNLSVTRRNEEDIGKIALKVGEGDVEGVSEYENRLVNIVGIIETLSSQVDELKVKVAKLEDGKKVSKVSKSLVSSKLTGIGLEKKVIVKQPKIIVTKPVVKEVTKPAVKEVVMPVVGKVVAPVVKKIKSAVEEKFEERNINKIINDSGEESEKGFIRKKVSKKKSKSRKKV